MLDEQNPLKIKKTFQHLPKDVQFALISVDTVVIIKSIEKEHRLHVDQAGRLADETASLMVGETKPKDFIKNIRKNVGTDEKTAREIAEKINEEIFKPIRESLKKIHQIGVENEGEAPPENVQPLEATVVKSIEDKEIIPGKEQRTPEGDPYREQIDSDDL